jgi:hypothetical protein
MLAGTTLVWLCAPIFTQHRKEAFHAPAV